MSSPYVLVRVRDGGSDVTVSRAYAEAQGLAVLPDKDAADELGAALPSKPITDKAGKPAAAKEA